MPDPAAIERIRALDSVARNALVRSRSAYAERDALIAALARSAGIRATARTLGMTHTNVQRIRDRLATREEQS